ncbi:hypothetical protein M9H77_23386 [Catharanthus roseus]|uniref:Uncharacterized protein n=1 Tax=Catharanthus roseus TaxID=4058 RepID=A0ACC0ASV6_CATRO|nr:hypothetical protein M9H77_23386 [Catharanthus roseus]
MSDGGRKRKRHNSQFDKVSVQLSGRVLRSAVRPRRSRRLVPKGDCYVIAVNNNCNMNIWLLEEFWHTSENRVNPECLASGKRQLGGFKCMMSFRKQKHNDWWGN